VVLIAALVFLAGIPAQCEAGRFDGEWVPNGKTSPQEAISAATLATTIDEMRLALGLERTAGNPRESREFATWLFAISRESRHVTCTSPDVIRVSHSVLEISVEFAARRKVGCTARTTLYMTETPTLDISSRDVTALPFGASEFSCMTPASRTPD
jgi:hypothetical protein